MSEPSPAYLWYPKDALNSLRISELSAAEECWYRRALDRSWLGEGVSSDPARLAIHIGKKCTVAAAKKILDIFFVPHKKDPSKMVNETQEKIRKKFLQSQRQKSQAGKRGMANRWKQKTLSDNSVITPPITENNNPFPYPSSFSLSDFKRLRDWAVSENSRFDGRLVEIAVIETLINRDGSSGESHPIKSGKYFEPEIKRICGKGGGISRPMIDSVLEKRRLQIATFIQNRGLDST